MPRLKELKDPWDRARQTPWHLLNGRWYKREDYFAPLGRASINGAKLRQLDYLVSRAYHIEGKRSIVTGASILSPQLSMTAIVAQRYGMPCTCIVGATKPRTMVEHPNVEIALAAGADFEIGSVSYNPALQQRVKQYEQRTGAFRVPYGITTPEDATDDEVFLFHSVGAMQVKQLPPGLEHLIVPFGSGNSATSLLLGLSRLQRKPRVTLVQIGPSKFDWMQTRLERMGVTPGDWDDMDVSVHVLHNVHYTYSDRIAASEDGITFHPTYEGKIVQQLRRNPERYPGWHNRDGTTGFWIVGSEPHPSATRDALHTTNYGSISRAA